MLPRFKDLESKIKSETSGYFESLLVALCKPRAEYMASEMHHAISGLGTQEGTLIETLLSGDNQEIRDIAVAYKNCKFNQRWCVCYRLYHAVAV